MHGPLRVPGGGGRQTTVVAANSHWTVPVAAVACQLVKQFRKAAVGIDDQQSATREKYLISQNICHFFMFELLIDKVEVAPRVDFERSPLAEPDIARELRRGVREESHVVSRQEDAEGEPAGRGQLVCTTDVCVDAFVVALGEIHAAVVRGVTVSNVHADARFNAHFVVVVVIWAYFFSGSWQSNNISAEEVVWWCGRRHG